MSRTKPVHTAQAIAAARETRAFSLSDLDVAPENLRYGEPADPDVPLLAETLFAAGQLQPLTVRPGRGRGERPAMALDGRRRLLALRLLAEEGRIAADFPVAVVVETDPARQAAAALLTNTAAPVHVADVIAAIGRMLKSRLDVPRIARALGHAEIDVKRLAALSALPQTALDALRQGRLNLRQVRLLARLPDADLQEELVQAALDGFGFQDWRITERLDTDRVTLRDRRVALVGRDAYVAAGGRIEEDLFGELAPVLLDPERLSEAWTGRARAIGLVFEAEGLAVHVTTGQTPDLPDDLETLAYVYGTLSEADLDAYRAARDLYSEASEAAAACLDETTEPERTAPALVALVHARLAMDQAGCGGRLATALVFRPDPTVGLEVRCLAPVEPEVEGGEETAEPDGEGDGDGTAISGAPRLEAPLADAPPPQVEGVNHALHGVRTEVATRGLIRALADDPAVALTALIARLFAQIALRGRGLRAEGAVGVTATAFNPTGGRIIDSLDGHVRDRLEVRRAAWEASDQTLIAWVHGLAPDERLGLIAELTALTLDVHETRTSQIRSGARRDAAELARLCGADITRHWTPDALFLHPHSKPLLLDMLQAMGEPTAEAAGLKKLELTTRVAESAAAARWAPSVLSWGAAIEDVRAAEAGQALGRAETLGSAEVRDQAQGEVLSPETEVETVAGTEAAGLAGDVDDPLDDVGQDEEEDRGVFVVTPAGEARLARGATPLEEEDEAAA